MKTATEWYKEGVKANSDRRYSEAMECFNEALKINPNFKEALNAKGSVFCNQGNYEEGMKWYDSAILLDPKYTSPWNSKGILYKNLGKYDEALKCHEKALEIDPNNKTGQENRAVLISAKTNKTFIASEPSIIRRFTARAAQSSRERFLGLLEKDYNDLLQKYQKKGREKFEAQYNEGQEKFNRCINEFEQALQQKNQNQQKIFQDSFQSVLNAYQVKSLSSLSELLLPQLEVALRQKLGQGFTEAMDKLLQSQQYQAEVQRLQQNIIHKIGERQNQMAEEVIHVQEKQNQLQGEHDPMFAKYLLKQQILKEQDELQNPKALRVFYNTIEKVLGSRLMSAMSLASGMMKREETSGEKRIGVGVNVVGKVLDCVPVVGTIAKTIITSALELGEMAYSSHQDSKHEKGYDNTANSFIRLDDALLVAEVIARRLAQSYQAYIVENNLSSEEAEGAGENAANIVYGCIKAGELNHFEGKSLEDKINFLIKKVQEEAQKQTGGFFKKAAVFKEPVAAMFSDADRKQVVTVTENIHALEQKNELKEKQHQMEIKRLSNQITELQKHMFLGASTTPPQSPIPKFSLIEEEHWSKANDRLRKECVEFFTLDSRSFQVKCTEKIVEIIMQSNPSEKVLKQFGNALLKVFEDIEDVDIQSATLKIFLKTSMNAKDLGRFFSQEIIIVAANQIQVVEPTFQFTRN